MVAKSWVRILDGAAGHGLEFWTEQQLLFLSQALHFTLHKSSHLQIDDQACTSTALSYSSRYILGVLLC